MTRLLCVIVLASACGSRPSAPAHPEPKPTAGSGSAVATTGVAGTPDDRDERCSKLVAHALALGEAERPADQQLTRDERTRIEAQLRSDWAPKCQQMTSRDHDCALAARTLAAVSACGG